RHVSLRPTRKPWPLCATGHLAFGSLSTGLLRDDVLEPDIERTDWFGLRARPTGGQGRRRGHPRTAGGDGRGRRVGGRRAGAPPACHHHCRTRSALVRQRGQEWFTERLSCASEITPENDLRRSDGGSAHDTHQLPPWAVPATKAPHPDNYGMLTARLG